MTDYSIDKPGFFDTGRAMIVGCLCLVMILLFSSAKATTIYLSRHAEKQPDSSDPDLTDAGHCRAAFIARLLSHAGIESIYSTDYRRTRSTAEPLANSLDSEIRLYDPRALEKMAETLTTSGAVAFVAGHSNTTPQLVRHLGGEAEAMDESEYTRLYQIIINEKTVTTNLFTLPDKDIINFCE